MPTGGGYAIASSVTEILLPKPQKLNPELLIGNRICIQDYSWFLS